MSVRDYLEREDLDLFLNDANQVYEADATSRDLSRSAMTGDADARGRHLAARTSARDGAAQPRSGLLGHVL